MASLFKWGPVLAVIVAMTLCGVINGQDDAPTDWAEAFQLMNEPGNDSITLFIGDTVSVNFSIISISVIGTFSISARAKDGANTFGLSSTTLENVVGMKDNYDDEILYVLITGERIAIEQIELVAEDDTGKSQVIWIHEVNVNRVEPPIARIVRYLVVVALVVAIFLIGITTDVMIIYSLIRRPYGILIGMFCQFIVMPFTAWTLSKIFQVDGPASLGLIIDGSCPGGSLSNVLSVLLDVDYVLSITMTFFSTLFALGFMPLNLLIYGRSFTTSTGQSIQTPFMEIFIQLVLLTAPLVVGIGIGYKWPKAKEFADKYVKPVSGLIMMILIATDLPFNLFIFDSPWKYFIVAIIFPLVGGTAGVVISKVLRLSTRQSCTVALETGVQNALLAVTVLYFFYPRPVSDLATRLPYLILIFTTIEGIVFTIIYLLLKKFYWHGCPFDDEEEDIKKKKEEDKEKQGDTKDGMKATEKQKNGEINGNVKTISGTVVAPSNTVSYDVGCQATFGDETLAEINVGFDPTE